MNKEFKVKLLNNASKLDALTHGAGEISYYTRKFIDSDDKHSLMWILSRINALDSSRNKKLKFLASELYDSLLLFLGAQKISEAIVNTNTDNNADDGKTLEDLQIELDGLVGLKNVKEKINELIAFHKCQILREKMHLKNAKNTLHMAFIGNPGTGKTSVARIVGRMYKKIGLLSKGHFVEVSRTDLIAGYQGQTALKVKKLIEKAKGGVLFIDEAYSITENSNSDSYGRECLTELTKALEDYRDDLVVIVAGYIEPMKVFFESNPGLKSRFNTFIEFPDYDADELKGILLSICKNNDYTLDGSVCAAIHEYLEQRIAQKDEDFANGRLVRNLYDDLTMNHAQRVTAIEQPTKEDLSTILSDDFQPKANREVSA